MKSMARYCILLMGLPLTIGMSPHAQTLYFPPLASSAWKEAAPDDLGWDVVDFHDSSVLIRVIFALKMVSPPASFSSAR